MLLNVGWKVSLFWKRRSKSGPQAVFPFFLGTLRDRKLSRKANLKNFYEQQYCQTSISCNSKLCSAILDKWVKLRSNRDLYDQQYCRTSKSCNSQHWWVEQLDILKFSKFKIIKYFDVEYKSSIKLIKAILTLFRSVFMVQWNRYDIYISVIENSTLKKWNKTFFIGRSLIPDPSQTPLIKYIKSFKDELCELRGQQIFKDSL